MSRKATELSHSALVAMGALHRAKYRAFRFRSRGHLTIHAGLHKTGSTSIQMSLRKAGLLLPAARADFRSEANLRLKLYSARSRGLIVSSEHFLGEMPDFYSTAAERIEFLRREFESVQLIVYLRPPLEWHESAFSQLIQQGNAVAEAQYFRNVDMSPVADFRQLVRMVGEFNRDTSTGWIRWAQNVVDDFSHVIGLELPRVPNQNMSLHPLALEGMRRLGERGEFSHSVMRSALAGWKPSGLEPISIFSVETQNRLLSRQMEWVESAGILEYFQAVPLGWEAAARTDVRPAAKDILNNGHMESLLEMIRHTKSVNSKGALEPSRRTKS